MLEEARKFYIKLEQKITCLIGKPIILEKLIDTHNSGGLDRIVTKYCPVTGDIIYPVKTYLSPQAEELVIKDIATL